VQVRQHCQLGILSSNCDAPAHAHAAHVNSWLLVPLSQAMAHRAMVTLLYGCAVAVDADQQVQS
jgi:hypothetical protein